MISLPKWKHLSGDGRETALEHEESKYWVPLAEVLGLADVSRWVDRVSEAGWATKEDLADLVRLLLDHVEQRRRLEAEQTTEAIATARADEAQIVRAAARAAADVCSRARNGETKGAIKFGTTWGKWTYVNDADVGPAVVYGSGALAYKIDLARGKTPEQIGGWVWHLMAKKWLSATDLADGTAALIACFADGELPSPTTSGSAP